MKTAVLEGRGGGTRWFNARNALNVDKMHQFKIARQVFHQKSVLYTDGALPCPRHGRVPAFNGIKMTREEFANFLKKLKTANDNGQDIDAIVKENEHRNVYFYNDGCIKKILASEKNLMLTTDLINAALNLVGSDRIENPQLVNPFIPGELGYRSVEPDLLLINDRGNGVPRDRISIDVQHENNDSLYSDRLVLYVARLTGSMEKPGDFTPLENLHVVSFQFFDAFKGSPNYLHTVQLRNQEQRVYFERQTVTLVEVNKFLKHAEQFAGDRSRIAQWLRAIDTLNKEADFSEFAGDPVFRVLQNEVKLCNFSAGYMLSNIMKDIDKSYWEYGAARKKAKEVAKNLLLDGDSVEKVSRNTGLPQSTVLELKKEIESPDT